MKTNFKAILILAAMPVVFNSCKKDNEEDITPTPTSTSALEVKTTSNIFANNADGHFTFFSLRTNAEVALADSATNKWDVAFFSTKILTNAGTSGSGSGGAVVLAQAFADVATAPADSLFKTDNTFSALAIPNGSGNGWYNYDGVNMVINPIAGRTLVIRTADGKFAKMEILSYYQNAPAVPTSLDVARYYTFRSSFQSDGSKALK
jgi:hypothetical protein